MNYVSPEYNQQLVELAEALVTPERFHTEQTLGQLAVPEVVEA